MSLFDNRILCFCILAFCLNAFVPLVDYYSPWYLMVGLLAIMLMYLQKDSTIKLFKGLRILFLGVILVLFQYWFTHRNADFTNFTINGVIAWVPCIIALLCNVIKLDFQKKIIQISFFVILLTSVTTILGLIKYPFASRNLATPDLGELRTLYTFLNIGGFEFIYSLVISIPLVVWLINNSKGCKRILNIAILFTFFYCIYMSLFTTALVLTLVAGVLLVLALKPNSKPLIFFLLVLFIILYYTRVLASIVYWISSLVESDYVADRLLQFALVLDGTDVSNIDTNTTTERIDITQRAIDSFLESPFCGNNFLSYDKNVMSGHSLILDILSSSGVIGFVFFVVIFYKIFKEIYKKSIFKVNVYVRITWLLFFAVSFVNPTSFPLIYYIIFPLSLIVNNLSMNEKVRLDKI